MVYQCLKDVKTDVKYLQTYYLELKKNTKSLSMQHVLYWIEWFGGFLCIILAKYQTNTFIIYPCPQKV